MFFPILVDVRKVVIIGGGTEWRRKVLKWSQFADEVLVVTGEPFEPGHNVTRWEGSLEPSVLPRLVEGATLVISDHPEAAFNEALHVVCSERNILLNVVDNRELSNVYATSYIDKPNLLVTLSTSGRCAYYTKQLRRELEPELTHRSQVAGILAELRSGVPRRYRREALETVYHDSEFRRFVDAHNYEEASARALDLGRRYFAFGTEE